MARARLQVAGRQPGRRSSQCTVEVDIPAIRYSLGAGRTWTRREPEPLRLRRLSQPLKGQAINTTGNTAESNIARQPSRQRLSRTDCLELLPTALIGRLVYTKKGKAATWLTKFSLDNSSILFTTSQDDVLHAAARGYMVAFETNAIDNRQRLRWTITVVGHLSLASSNEVPDVTSQLSQSILPPAQPIRLVIAATQGTTEAL